MNIDLTGWKTKGRGFLFYSRGDKCIRLIYGTDKTPCLNCHLLFESRSKCDGQKNGAFVSDKQNSLIGQVCFPVDKADTANVESVLRLRSSAYFIHEDSSIPAGLKGNQ